MKTYYECIPCFIKQTLRALGSIDAVHHEPILRKVLHLLGDIDFSMSPPELAGKGFKIIENYAGAIDHFSEAKKKSNQYILDMYDPLSEIVLRSKDPFDTAMRLAIAGNVIDFGAKHDFSDDLIHEEIDKALAIKKINSGLLKNEIKKADHILYIGDNAGEIVFDKLFIEQMPLEKITYAVRGRPVLNDATIKDAEMIGLTKLIPVISNGSGLPGTVLKDCSTEFKKIFNKADLVISKGQGNYETLSDSKQNIIFLLKVKCSVLARDIGRQRGSFVVAKNSITI